jgi:hypothetical protein
MSTATPPPLPQPPKPGWMTRNWKWFVPAIVLLTAALGVTCFVAIFSRIKTVEPYQRAVAAAKASPEVQAALGVPVEDGFASQWMMTSTGSSGSASFDIPISGPKGKGTLHVEAAKLSGVWSFTELDVVVRGQAEKIELPR